MQVCLARIVGAHGIKGLVKVRSFTHNPIDLFKYKPLVNNKGQTLSLHMERFLPNGILLCRLDGCVNRNDADLYKGIDLFVERSILPKLEEETYYYADLNGLTVVDQDKKELGYVKAIHDHGAGVFLDVVMHHTPKTEATLPFYKECVVDLTNKQLVIDPNWLIDTSPDEKKPDELHNLP